MKQGTCRPEAAQKLKAGLTSDGKLNGWYRKVATPSAIANAFYASQGKRLRHMPFTPERVTAAIDG